MSEVRKQRRKKSLELHPDKAGYESTEIYQKFIVANDNLLKYLAENDIFEDENEDWEDWTEDELEAIFKKGSKVRDHCHFTGKFRGAAHNACNLLYRKVKKIPVFFHNLSGYDGHIIFQNLNKVEGIKTPEVIARSMEKFITFSIGQLHFKDSAQFLISSLDKLVANLKVKGIKENIIKELFNNT